MLIRLRCNGGQVALDVPPTRLLSDVLREDLGLTGTKVGCGTGDCGACTVLLDGEPANACIVLAAECDGRAVDTVEGVARTELGTRVVERLATCGGVQCGICTPGFVVSAVALLTAEPSPDRATVARGLSGNLCRCTGYYGIIDAVVASGDAAGGTT